MSSVAYFLHDFFSLSVSYHFSSIVSKSYIHIQDQNHSPYFWLALYVFCMFEKKKFIYFLYLYIYPFNMFLEIFNFLYFSSILKLSLLRKFFLLTDLVNFPGFYSIITIRQNVFLDFSFCFCFGLL